MAPVSHTAGPKRVCANMSMMMINASEADMSDVNRGVSTERWLGTERSHIYIKVYVSRRININLEERCSTLLQHLSLSHTLSLQICPDKKICHMPLNKQHTQMQIMSCKFHKLHSLLAFMLNILLSQLGL